MSLNWLFLDLNSFFASVEQAEDPKLRGKPVAVVPMMADNTSVLAASYPAKAFGVKTGTLVKDAKRMCPGIIFVEGQHRKYIKYHNRILEVVDTCLPVAEVASIDEMAFELVGREKVEANARGIAQKIKEAIYREISDALTCSIGIAPNKYLAKVASDMQKPNGLTVIKLEDIPSIFMRLGIRDYPGIGANMERRFFDYGCKTVKKLYELSPSEHKEIWGGINGDIFYRLIRGENIPSRETKRRTIGHSHVLSPRRRNYEDAYATCVRLLAKACLRLREEGFFTKELSLEVKFIDNVQNDKYFHAKSKVLETQDTCLLCEELERMWKDVPKNRQFLKVGITLSNFAKAEAHQISMFENLKREPLMKAWDKLNIKYAKNLVYPAGANPVVDNSTARIAFQRIPKEYE